MACYFDTIIHCKMIAARGGDERSYPTPEARADGPEELPHTPKPKAKGDGREEQPHDRGQGR